MDNILTYEGPAIYMATCKANDKKYIGKAVNFKLRYRKHKSAKYYKTAFHNAIKKYGFEQFIFEILETPVVSNLIKREVFYIDLYDTLSPNGYNLRKDSKENSGFKHTHATKDKLSAAGKGRPSWHAGKKVGSFRTKEGTERFKEKMTGALNPNARAVYQISDIGYYIHACISDAARVLNINFRGISRCALGQRKSYFGYKWSYIEPDSVAIQDLNLFNCWKPQTGDAVDNQQGSLSDKEPSTTIAEMRVEASASKQETSLQKDDDIV